MNFCIFFTIWQLLRNLKTLIFFIFLVLSSIHHQMDNLVARLTMKKKKHILNRIPFHLDIGIDDYQIQFPIGHLNVSMY